LAILIGKHFTNGSLRKEGLDLTSGPTKFITEPSSQLVQKLVDKGFAKVKTKSNVDQVPHPTNRILNRFAKSTTSGSQAPDLAVHQNEHADKLKGKSIRQISVKTPSLTSSIPEAVSTNTTTTSPTISAANFYSSKVSRQAKIKINIKSNPKSTSIPSKTEKHSTSLPNYSILKKKEVVLTGIMLIIRTMYMCFLLLPRAELQMCVFLMHISAVYVATKISSSVNWSQMID